MKKIYSFISAYVLACAFCVNVTAMDFEESYTLYDLTHEKMNNSYVDNHGNAFSVLTNEPTAGPATFSYLSDIENPVECAGETTSGLDAPVNANGNYTRFIMRGASNANTLANSPYFIIKFEPAKIKQIQQIGRAHV